MLHEPAQQFQPAQSQSRVAFLAAEYERWRALYDQVSDQQEALPLEDIERRKPLDVAEGQAVRRMDEILKDLTVTRAHSLRDLALKARIARLENSDLSSNELTGALLLDLMEVASVPPIDRRDFEPREVLPSFIEPARLPTQPDTREVFKGIGTNPNEDKGLSLKPLSKEIGLNALLPPACCVAELGKRSRRFLDMLDQVDRPGFDDRGATGIGNALLNGCAAAAIQEQAVSAEGALFQVAVAYDLAVINRDDGDPTDVSLLLWSVRRFLEKHHGVAASDLAGDYWMPAHTNPIANLESTALAAESAPTKASHLQAAE